MATEHASSPREIFDLADLYETPNDGNRYEVLDGSLVVSPPPSLRHQDVVGRLYRLLDDARPSTMRVFVAPLAWRIGAGQVPEPDLVVVENPPMAAGAIEVPPALAVEVVSPTSGNRDLFEKRRIYAVARCPTYWVVDPAQPSLLALHLEGQQYQEVARVQGSEAYRATRPFPLTVVPSGLVR